MARKLTHAEFVVKAKAVHGGRYDYADGCYDGRNKEVSVLCQTHGWFSQTAGNHLSGKGCSKCGNTAIGLGRRKTLPQFIEDAKRVHGDTFDYSKVIYKNGNLPVVIGCPSHGWFTQTPESHLVGANGCKDCKSLSVSSAQLFTFDDFIAKARAVHGVSYIYDKAVYAGTKTPLTIICKKHGAFKQTPDAHYAGSGCPRCGSGRVSKSGSAFIDAVEALGVTLEREAHPFPDKRLSVDALLPGIALEYHGLFWHSSGSPSVNSLAAARRKHLDRRKLCEAAGLRYVAVYEDEWLNEPEKVITYLRNLVGKSPVEYARRLSLRQLSIAEARAFYEKHHFMGAPTALYNTWALVDFLDRPVGAMTLTLCKEVRGVAAPAEWSLTRMAFDGTRVVGGASRLFKACRAACPDAEIISYVDLDKFTGGVYEALGFTLEHEITPDYWTLWPGGLGWKGYKRRHKSATKRANLAKMEGFDPALSEFENCKAMGLHFIFHSGRLKMRFSPTRR